jgi:hypothetical protein
MLLDVVVLATFYFTIFGVGEVQSCNTIQMCALPAYLHAFVDLCS